MSLRTHNMLRSYHRVRSYINIPCLGPSIFGLYAQCCPPSLMKHQITKATQMFPWKSARENGDLIPFRKSLTIWTLRKLQFQDTTTSVQDTLKILHLLSRNFSESPSTLIPKLWQRLSTNQNPNYLTPASNRLCQSSHGCSHYEGGSMLPGHARQEPAIEIALSLSISLSLSLFLSRSRSGEGSA